MASDPKYTSYGDRGDVRGEPTPYGPHHDHKVDEAAGGADNSPLETEPNPEQHDLDTPRRPAPDQPDPGAPPAPG